MTPMTITKEHAIKFLELCDAGLTKGLGHQRPGSMCIEACWNAALGLPHGDDPPCVGKAVRAAKIALNDAAWSDNMARSRGMRAIGIAQAGSDGIDQMEFSRLLQEGYRGLLPRYPAKDGAEAGYNAARAADYIARVASAAAYTARSAEFAASAAAYTALAAAYTALAAQHPDEVLRAFADVILEALKTLKSPGCEYLYLIEQKP